MLSRSDERRSAGSAVDVLRSARGTALASVPTTLAATPPTRKARNPRRSTDASLVGQYANPGDRTHSRLSHEGRPSGAAVPLRPGARAAARAHPGLTLSAHSREPTAAAPILR